AFAVNADVAAVSLDESFDHREPQAKSAAGSIDGLRGLGERLKYVRQHVGRDAHAGVAHAQHNHWAFDLEADDDSAASRCEFFRVAQEVAQRLGQANGISVHPKEPWLEMALEVNTARFEAHAMVIHGAAHQISELQAFGFELDLAARNARDVEQIVDQARHV